MSLEDKLQENTEALNALREVIQGVMHLVPPAPIPAPAPEPTPAPVEVEQPKEPKPQSKPQPEPEAKKEEPAPAMSPAELKKALSPKVQDLFIRNEALGRQLLAEFGVEKLSQLSDDQLPSFSKRVDTALQGI